MNIDLKKIVIISIKIIAIVVLCEFVYWRLIDFITLGPKPLKSETAFFYYILPGVVLFSLTLLLYYLYNKLPVFVSNFLFVLIIPYMILSTTISILDNCDENKNLDTINRIVVLSLIFLSLFLLRKVLIKMKLKDIIIVLVATIILLFDFIFTHIGYKLFY